MSASKRWELLREWGFWILLFMPWVAVLIRFWVSMVPEFGFFPLPMALLVAFLVLNVSVPAISTRCPVLTQPCLFLQTALIAVLIQTAPPKLGLADCTQAAVYAVKHGCE